MTTSSIVDLHINLDRAILPEATTLGVIGGGQLGRMFVQAAQQMGYGTAVLDHDPKSPAGLIAHHHIQTAYTDTKGLDQLSQICAAITTEFENVPAQSLSLLAQKRPVYPKANAVSIAQDRTLEKKLFTTSGIGCAPYLVIDAQSDFHAIDKSIFPALLKTARLGYDGKGQATVHSVDELIKTWDAFEQVTCVLEKKLPLAAEVSVLVARGHDGQCVHFPVQYNIHRNGILAITEVPLLAHQPAAFKTWQTQAQQATTAAKKLAADLDYVGVLCVEFFILQDGQLIANEIAPRPHNSAHWTMNACAYSQFEAQVRTLAGLPLYEPKQHSNAIMLNLLGDLWFNEKDEKITPPFEKILTLPQTHLHLYGKADAKKERKMGHLNITAPTFDEAKKVALQAAALLNIAPW